MLSFKICLLQHYSYVLMFFTVRVKQIQNELGTQILADFEEALSVKGVKVHD